jgi:redox-sensitive bicupin YhaK (pirin superfamily)
MTTTSSTRRITHRSAGHGQGITRLMSPGDLGERLKPFVFLDHFETDGRGMAKLPWHPHSGIATHTTLLGGEVTYEDSTGKSGSLSTGNVEYMQAGEAVWHTGGLRPGRAVRGFQLWLALPDEDEMAPAQSHYVDAVDVPTDGRVRVLLGTYEGMASPLSYRAPLTYLHVRLSEGDGWRYQPASDHDVAWLAVSEGALSVNEVTTGRELLVFEDGNGAIDVVAATDVEFVIGSAARHPTPLVLGHYSVHSSRDRLRRGIDGIRELRATLTTTDAVVDYP